MTTLQRGLAATLLITMATVGVVHVRHLADVEQFAVATTAIDIATQARLQLARAYLIRTRLDQGDPAFRAADAPAAVDRARLMLSDWLKGRAPTAGVRGVPALADTTLRRLVAALDGDLSRFGGLIDSRTDASFDVERRILYGISVARADSILLLAEGLVAGSIGAKQAQHLATIVGLTLLLIAGGGLVARFADRESRAAEQSELLRHLAEALAQAASPEAVARAARAAGCETLHTSISATLIVDEDRSAMVVLESAGLPPGLLDAGQRFPDLRGMPFGPDLERGGVRIVSLDPPALHGGEMGNVVAQVPGVRTAVVVPLLDLAADGPRLLGIVAFGLPSAAQPTPEQLEVLDGLEQVTAPAMARAVAERAEHAARAVAQQERERLAEVLEHVPVGIVVADAEGRFVHRNAAVDELLGGGGAASSEFEPRLTGAIHADGTPYDATEYPMTRAVRRGETVHSEVTRFRRADGSERLLAISAVPLAKPGDPSRGVVGTLFDVTALQRAEAARVESEQRFQLMAERLPLGIFRNDAAGRVEYANSRCAEIFGLPEHDLLRQGWQRTIHPEDRLRIDRERMEARDGPESRRRFELRIRRGTDHAIRDINLLAVYIRDAAGAVVEAVGVVEDVTERKSLEAQLRQAQKMEAIGRLAGGVAHDFNNLLTVIGAVTELMLADSRIEEDQANDLREIHDAARRARDLTRQLLAFSRRQTLTLSSVHVDAVVTRTHQMLTRLVGEDYSLELDLEPDLPMAHADAGAVEQILMNLAVNARDAMPDGGRITLRAHRAADAPPGVAPDCVPRAGYVAIELADEGSGMDESTQARIFEPFFTTKAEGRGTGLGLAMVYGLVQQMQGDITVHSDVGVGSVFTVYLPVADAAKAPRRVSGGVRRTPGGHERLLVVEDDAALRKLVKRALSDLGYTVYDAANATAALAIAAQEPDLDLLFTDIVLPGVSGSRLAEEVRALHPTIRVLFTSGYNEDELLQRQVQQGAELLEKPFLISQLASRIREVLEAQRVS